jgi:DNA-binding MarR family transcriptional regulator
VGGPSAAEPDLDRMAYYVYIHSMDKDERALQEACSRVVADCACEGLRRTARAVTQHYEDALAPSGLRATQFPIVVALASAGPLPVTRLAQALGLDRTTLTRNMRALVDHGLIAVADGEDRRTRVVALTPQGRERVTKALGMWEQAQASVEERFGLRRLRGLHGELSRLTEIARGAPQGAV